MVNTRISWFHSISPKHNQFLGIGLAHPFRGSRKTFKQPKRCKKNFRRQVCLSNSKHAPSRELPLTVHKTVFSQLNLFSMEDFFFGNPVIGNHFINSTAYSQAQTKSQSLPYFHNFVNTTSIHQSFPSYFFPIQFYLTTRRRGNVYLGFNVLCVKFFMCIRGCVSSVVALYILGVGRDGRSGRRGVILDLDW